MFDDIVHLENNVRKRDDLIAFSFFDGAKAEIRGHSNLKYDLNFYNGSILEYHTSIGTGFYASPSKKYYVPWKIQAWNKEKLIKEEVLDLKGKRVLINIDSSSIGDTIAWVPQAVNFAKKHQCKLILNTFFNEIFDYEDVEFTAPGTPCTFYASYSIGYYLGENSSSHTPGNPRESSLGKVAADILGIEYTETLPKIIKTDTVSIEGKYVCIATMSTAGAKLWQRDNAWQDIIDYLNYKGYRVKIIQKESQQFDNVIDLTGNHSLTDRIAQLRGAEFFIGLGSGLSWLAWAVKIPVILISGFSRPYAEFQTEYRVINENVCNGCWNNSSYTFDKGNWNWCPEHENSEHQFECTKKISPVMVIREIDKLTQQVSLL